MDFFHFPLTYAFLFHFFLLKKINKVIISFKINIPEKPMLQLKI